MRKVIVAEFMTIDGVIQNEENDGDGFKYGGWFFPYADEVTGAVVQERLAKPADLLLGRKTFDGWEGYWPTHSNFWPNVMTATKYVASNTRDSSDWVRTVFLSGDVAEKVREIKAQDGPDIYVMGSEIKYEDNGFCYDHVPDDVSFGCRIGAAKTGYGVRSG